MIKRIIFNIINKCTIFLNRRQFIAFAKIIAIFYYVFNIKSKSIVKHNLKKNGIKFSIKLYLNFALFFSEYIYLMHNEINPNIFEIHNIDILEKALKKKKGVMLLTMHMGGWDIAGQYLAYKGYPINVIYEYKSEWIYKHIDKIRQKYSLKLIDRNSDIYSFISVIKNNEILCVFIDRASENLTLKTVEFLNQKREMPYGWYRLSKHIKPAIILTWTVYKDNKHHIYFKNTRDYNYEEYYKFITRIIKKDIYQYDFYDKIWQDIVN